MSAIKILLVEDEKDIQFIIELSLGRSGEFEITTFDSGFDALDFLSDTQAGFDLALVNFRLPGMHGLEFIARMQAIPAFANLRAIIVSAALLDREMTAYRNSGVLGVISKPFEVAHLAQQVLALYRSEDGCR